MNGFGRGNKQQDREKTSILTRETVGMTLLLFSVVCLFITITGPIVFGDIGLAITAFFIGFGGFFIYPLFLLLIYAAFRLIIGKSILPPGWISRSVFLLVSVFFIVHIATAERFFAEEFGGYLAGCWAAATEGAMGGTGGGILFGLICYPIRLLLSAAGAYVLFAFVTLAAFALFVLHAPVTGNIIRYTRRKRARESDRAKMEKEAPESVSFEDLPTSERAPMPAYDVAAHQIPQHEESYFVPESAPVEHLYDPRQRSHDVLFGGSPKDSYRNNLIFDSNSAFNARPRSSTVRPASPATAPARDAASATPARDLGSATPASNSYAGSFSSAAEQSRPPMPKRISSTPREYSAKEDSFNYPQTPSYRAPLEPEEVHGYTYDVPTDFSSAPNVNDIEEPITPPVQPESPVEPASRLYDVPTREEQQPLFGRDTAERASDRLFSEPRESRYPTEDYENKSASAFAELQENSAAELFDDDAEDLPIPDETRSGRGLRGIIEPEISKPLEPQPPQETPSRLEIPRAISRVSTAQEAPKPKKHVWKKYQKPNLALLRQYDDRASVSQEEILRNSDIIIDTLRNFRVEAEIVKVTCGSAVTRYDFDIPKNITVGSVLKYEQNIAMRLSASDGVQMYVNYETGAISIEVPNANRATVGLRSVLFAEDYVRAKPNALMFGMGQDIEGRNVCGNIVKMKHLLVAGSTGSGKSVCLNALLVSLIAKYAPEDMRLILIDPKKVGFAVYEGLPHLMINEIINEPQKAVSALNWAIKEMERRYSVFEQKTKSGTNVQDIDDYNKNLTEDEEKLCKFVIVFDELADFMMVAKKEIEERIQRLTQKARAAGIHLVIATQRPSVDVITGVIKGNLPTRIAFRTIQEVDSRTILDEKGAENLLGNGDMLYTSEGMRGTKRVQGAYIDPDEVMAIVSDIKANNEAYYDDDVSDYINKSGGSESGGSSGPASFADDGAGGVAQVYVKALGIVVELGQASISLIQRKCSVGYNHAGKIIEWMESMGYISPFDGKAKARSVLLTKEEFEAKYGGEEGC